MIIIVANTTAKINKYAIILSSMLNDFIPNLYALDEITDYTVWIFIPSIPNIFLGFKNSKYTIDSSMSKNNWDLYGKFVW